MKNYFTILATLLIITFAFAGKIQSQPQPVLTFPKDGATGITDGTTFTWINTGSDKCSIFFMAGPSGYATYFMHGITDGSFTIDNSIMHLAGNTTYYWYISDDDNGLPSYSFFTFTTDASMPVQLNSFNASVLNNAVTLTWSTATEVNNYGFDVESSTDGKTFNKIGFVAGSGNSNSTKNYSYTDSPNSATVSYRLKQINNDGSFTYSDVLTVTLNSDNTAKLMNNYPNPFNPSTSIKFYIPNNSDVTIKIYDILGREVTTLINKQSEAGYHIVYWNGIDRNGNSVASGTYICRMQAGNFLQTKKLMLMK
jgi:FlgD Ig-like domain